MVEDDAARQARLEMGDVALLGGAVDDQVEMIAAAGDHQVVDDAALGVEQQRIFGPRLLEDGEVGGEQGFEPLLRLGAGDEQLAHMADVEQAGRGAGPQMLGDDPLILDRHRVAGERDHAPAFGAVPAVEREGLFGLTHAPAPERIMPRSRAIAIISGTPSVAGT